MTRSQLVGNCFIFTFATCAVVRSEDEIFSTFDSLWTWDENMFHYISWWTVDTAREISLKNKNFLFSYDNWIIFSHIISFFFLPTDLLTYLIRTTHKLLKKSLTHSNSSRSVGQSMYKKGHSNPFSPLKRIRISSENYRGVLVSCRQLKGLTAVKEVVLQTFHSLSFLPSSLWRSCAVFFFCLLPKLIPANWPNKTANDCLVLLWKAMEQYPTWLGNFDRFFFSKILFIFIFLLHFTCFSTFFFRLVFQCFVFFQTFKRISTS